MTKQVVPELTSKNLFDLADRIESCIDRFATTNLHAMRQVCRAEAVEFGRHYLAAVHASIIPSNHRQGMIRAPQPEWPPEARAAYDAVVRDIPLAGSDDDLRNVAMSATLQLAPPASKTSRIETSVTQINISPEDVIRSEAYYTRMALAARRLAAMLPAIPEDAQKQLLPQNKTKKAREEDLPPGEWLLPPRSLVSLAVDLGNITRRKARALLNSFELRNYPLKNRQSWTVNLKNMPKHIRDRLQKPARTHSN